MTLPAWMRSGGVSAGRRFSVSSLARSTMVVSMSVENVIWTSWPPKTVRTRTRETKSPGFPGLSLSGSDGTRTRDLRRDRPSWRLRADRGSAGFWGVSRALRRWLAGISGASAGVSGDLLRDERGMRPSPLLTTPTGPRASSQGGCSAPDQRYDLLGEARHTLLEPWVVVIKVHNEAVDAGVDVLVEPLDPVTCEPFARRSSRSSSDRWCEFEPLPFAP
jgi:hypothetical protein